MEGSPEERLISPPEKGGEEVDLNRKIWTELKLFSRIAAPTVVTRLSNQGVIVVTQMFFGHVGKSELAAYALTQTVFLRFVTGILVGMSSATETLCGQALGAGQHHMMSIYLQRSWIVDGVTATLFAPIFIFSGPILRLLGMEGSLAATASKFSLYYIPYLYATVLTMTIQMFLMAQMKNFIIGVLSVSSFGLHVLLSWIFVYVLDIGASGPMIALCLSTWALVIGELVYIVGGWCPSSWSGFNKAAFTDLWPIVKLSVSSGVMLCLTMWYNAVLVLIAGYMTNATVAVSAFSICLNISNWENVIFIAFTNATSVRIANELGRGNVKAMKLSMDVILTTSMALGIVFFFLCVAFSKPMSYLFTSDTEVVDLIQSVSLLLSISMFLNSIQPILTGVAIGAGIQGRMAIVSLVCYYVVGVPVGALLGYVVDLGINGLWIGMLCGVALQILVLCYLIYTTNWEDQVSVARKRIKRWSLPPPEECNENDNRPQA